MSTQPEPKILDKIRKLLRLASSSNQHEAAAAAARAAELMLEHQISEAKLDVLGIGPQEAIGETDIASVGSKIVHWKGLIVKGLCEAFGTSWFWQWNYVSTHLCSCGKKVRDYDSHFKDNNNEFNDPKHQFVMRSSERAVSVRIVGRPTETQTVSYMFAYLTKEVDRLASEMYDPDQDENVALGVAANVASRKWKESFRLGAAEEIWRRLIAQKQSTRAKAQTSEDGSQALVRIDKDREAIEEWKHQQHPDLRSVKRSQANPDADGYRAGRSAGRNVNLGGNKGLGAPPKRIGDG